MQRQPESTTEELHAAIAQLQDENNELRSANGELKSSNEQLQSVATEQRERQLEVEAELRDAVVQRDRLFATLSHELRNPFEAILHANRLLQVESLDPESRREARELIEGQLRSLSLILDNLLDVSHFTSGKFRLQTEPVDVTRMVPSILDCVRHRVDSADQTLHIQVGEEPIYVMADQGRLQQVQVNLLVNASKYSPPHHSIWYSVSRDGDQAVITVRDEGKGISASLLPEIFEPFIQSEHRSEGGMGLGLALVKAIVETHQGTVEAHSLGQDLGSEFVVRLPTTNDLPKRDMTQSAETTATSGLRVLLVEDNDGIRKMLARSLEIKGFEVVTAADGRSGLAKAERGDPNVAIVDIGLPDLDGYEFARTVRSDPRHASLTLIAVTGHGRGEDKKLAHDAGFDLHLVKPIDPESLVAAINRLGRPSSPAAEPNSPQ